MGVVVRASFRLMPDLQYIKQHQQIEDADDPQKYPGYARADNSSNILQLWQLLPHASGGERYSDCKADNHSRMPKEKKKPTPSGFSLLQHETHRIVDRGNMVGIECVPQSKHVSDQAKADKRGMQSRVMQIKAPTDTV